MQPSERNDAQQEDQDKAAKGISIDANELR